jgi:arsenate reductase
VRIAEELGVDADIVLYMKTPPDEPTLRAIIAKLEDPVTDLVRRDSLWKKLGLTDADAATPDQVVALLTKHKALLQRPVVVTSKKAIIGRPKDRVRELLAG